MKYSNHGWRLVAATIVLAVAVASCTTDYVTGKKTFSLVSESEEIATGRDANPQVVAEYGLYPDEDLAKFVSQLGQAVAQTSHRPQLEYTFQVLDTHMVNAFALSPGESSDRVYEVDSKLALVQLIDRRMPEDVNLEQGVEQEREQLSQQKQNLLAQGWLNERRKELTDTGNLVIDLTLVSRNR